MERLCYSSPSLAAPYGYPQPRYNPTDEAYRYALRILEQSRDREMRMLYTLGMPYGMSPDDYYRREHEIQSRYHYERDRLESDFTRNAKQYYYRSRFDDYASFRDYSMPTYLLPKETTPVPTETKKYIIVNSKDGETSTYFDGNNDTFTPYATLADAEEDAQALARENPTEEYTIYQTLKKYKVAGTPLDTTLFV